MRKIIISGAMAYAFRRADGTLPDNVMVWDGPAPYSWRKPRAVAATTRKGKVEAQWKRERRQLP